MFFGINFFAPHICTNLEGWHHSEGGNYNRVHSAKLNFDPRVPTGVNELALRLTSGAGPISCFPFFWGATCFALYLGVVV